MAEKLILENIDLIRSMRNFAGREGMFNDAGNRNFAVRLPQNRFDLDSMLEDGWNVKFFKPRDEHDVPDAFLNVTVSYRVRKPSIILVTDEGRIQTPLDEDSIDVIDYADIESADVIINPYEWSVRGEHGVKAYLEKAWINIREDKLTRKYRQLQTGDHGWEN